MSKVHKVTAIRSRGHGEHLLLEFSLEGASAVSVGLDAHSLDELMRHLLGAFHQPDAPAAIRGVLQTIATRSVKVSVHGAATPVLIQEIEAGIEVATTIERSELLGLQRQIELALAATDHAQHSAN